MNAYEQIKPFLKDYCRKFEPPVPINALAEEVLDKVQEASVCIHTNLFDSILTVGWMKEQCNIHHKYFAAQFELCMGHTPKAYIMHHRIEASKHILQQTDATITTVALSLGFGSLSSFDKAFKNRVGVHPSDWRTQSG